VATWYESLGWSVVARNYRSTRGELDVVVFKDGVLAVCEVKSRATTAMGHPFESITGVKQLRVRRATTDFLDHLRRTDARAFGAIRQVRFDAASVIGNDIEVLCDAF